ncbi:MAG: hypothetical protein MZV64_60590 [Ignavibacteriales bacterium]|nr:hypothetical protein [Ignavibacteriales bacterium]
MSIGVAEAASTNESLERSAPQGRPSGIQGKTVRTRRVGSLRTAPPATGGVVVCLLPSALKDDEYDQCRHQQDGDLHAWAHEHRAAAMIRVPSTAARAGIGSSTHGGLSQKSE